MDNQEGCAVLKNIISMFNMGQSVHPDEPIILKNSEFLQIKKNKIRILHVKPDKEIPTNNLYEAVNTRSSINRNSLAEDYWFTRWNKPLSANCNCSFRKSQRYSLSSTNAKSSRSSYLKFSKTKIADIEMFVERLIQETLFEVFQELYGTKQQKGCYSNFAFHKSLEHIGTGPAILPTESTTVTFRNRPNHCNHSKKTISHIKPVIMLLHGIGSSADVWWNVINGLLQKQYEIIAPDMLGHGYSSAPNKPHAYTFKSLLKHTIAVYDSFANQNENRKFVIIGHSFGCSLATALCRYRPQQITQLILISGGGPTALSSPVSGNEVSVFSCLQLLISPLLFCGFKRNLFYSSRGKHFEPCNLDSSIPKYIFDYIEMGQNWPEGDAAFHRRILIPTLLVHGLKDTQVTLVQECEMERTIPRAFLELIPSAGHMSVLETPEHLNHMILCFVDWWSR